ncbi:MAG TPA: CvpA family protein [Candidatus Limnocylindrales bacterium]
MDIGGILSSINKFDLIVVLFCFGMFVLGYIQGTIRRILGLASILFSFLLAANLRDSFGVFLANNWNQFPDEYAVMLGFGIVFVAASIAFTIVIQGFYHKQELFQKAPVIDEVTGGLLGIVQALLLVGCVIVILDSFFRIPTIPKTDGELGFLRSLFDEMNTSITAELFRTKIIPGFFQVFGLFIPADLKAFYISA